MKNTRQKKILFVSTHSYFPQRAGGSESTTHDFCIELRTKGWEPAVLASLDVGDRIYFSNRLKSNFSRDKYPSDNFLGYRVYRGWNVVEGIKSTCDKFMPDLAVVQAGNQFSVGEELLNVGVPFIWYVHDVDFDQQAKNAGGESKLEKILESSIVIANSEFTAKSFYERFSIRAHVLPPLVSYESQQSRAAANRSYALFVNPIPQKGVDIVFELARRRPDIPFLVVEGWPLNKTQFAEFNKIASDLRNITIQRRLPDLREVYMRSRLLLVPSICEEA